MKKIALIHYAYPPAIGGVEIMLREQASVLARLGYDVLVLTGKGKEANPKISLKQIKEFQSVVNFNPALQKKILEKGIIDDDFYQLAAKIEAILEKELASQETIIVHNMLTVYRNLPFIYAFKKYAQKHKDKKYLVWVHDHMYASHGKIRLKQVSRSQLERELLSEAIPRALYIVISETFKKLLFKVMDVVEDKLIVVPDGVNIKNFLEIDDSIWKVVEKYSLLNAFPLIVSPVNILPRKNLDYALSVVSHLVKSYPDTVFLISGQVSRHRDTKEYLVLLEEKIAKLSLEEKVVFLSGEIAKALKESEIHDLYDLADMVFYFSKSENFGLPILEAALAKTPIFVSNLDVFREIGGDRLVYIDYDKITPRQVAQKVKKYIRESQTISMNRLARQKYSLETIIKEKLVPFL